MSNRKEFCRDCFALVDGENELKGEWVCDIAQDNVENIECCPEDFNTFEHEIWFDDLNEDAKADLISVYASLGIEAGDIPQGPIAILSIERD